MCLCCVVAGSHLLGCVIAIMLFVVIYLVSGAFCVRALLFDQVVSIVWLSVLCYIVCLLCGLSIKHVYGNNTQRKRANKLAHNTTT